LLPHLLPPYATLFLAPFGLLPFRVAYAIWGLAGIAFLAAGVVALVRAGGLAGKQAWLLGLLSAAYFPVFALVLQGQSDDVAVLGLGLAALAWTRGRPGWAGLAASLALVKPQLVLLLPVLFLARSPLRAFPAFAGTGVALVAGSLPFFGISGWRDYLGLVLPWLTQGHSGFPIEGQSAFSLRGALEHLPIGSTATLVMLVLLLVVVAASFWIRPPRPRLDFGLAVAASVALSSYLNVHDLVLLLVPLLLLTSLLLEREVRRPALGWAALAFSYAGVQVYLIFGAAPAAAGVIALAAYLLSERLTPAAPEPRPSSPILRRPLESTASAAALRP
jgi:hypothetical protein